MDNSFQADQRPQLLKDLLIIDSNSTSPSFKLLRSRSKAASKTISAIRRASKIVIAAVNYLPFTSVKTPSVSRRSGDGDGEVPISITVKVKDILRWRSFRDLAEEKPPPSDFASSPHRCTTATTTTASTSTATSSSRSSWCGSDFASEEDLHLWCGDSDDVYCGENKGGSGEGKNYLPGHGVGGNYTEATKAIMMVDSQGELAWEEREKQSPVSVLDFSVLQQDEKFISSSPHSLAKLEPLNLDKKFCSEQNLFEHHHNGAEEKAKQMLNHVKSNIFTESCETIVVDHLLLDFFMHELTTSRRQKDDNDSLRVAKAWMSEEKEGFLEWEMGGKREACIREMEMRGVMRWNNFVEEQEEMALQMEAEVLSYLVDEILIDFLNH